MDQVESQTTPSSRNLPERPSFWYFLKNPPTYSKPLVTLVAVTFFLSALGTIVYFTTIGKGQISFFPPPTAMQQPTPSTSTLPTSTPTPDLYTESSPSATAIWKTYRNIKDAISFRYPDGWKLTVEDTHTGYDEVTVSKIIKVPMPDKPNKEIESIEEEFYIYPVKDNGLPQFTNWKPDIKRLIDNIECEGKESEGSQQVPPSRYYECIFNNTNFGISLVSIKRDYAILDQILSTFRFTDQEQVDNSRSCRKNSDCTLFVCGGCYNKEWAKTAPPDSPCMIYAGYTCECSNNQCIEVK